jgi:hypothetical protein
LSAACIKGGREGRHYRVPRTVLAAIAAYTDPVEGSRTEAVRRAQRAGRKRGIVSRTPRERDAERAAIKAAADRLLAGTPLRSASGKLTTSELITETGLRRDVIYADYRDLVEEFQKLTEVAAELTEERAAGAALRGVVAELSLELQQARDELAAYSGVTPIRPVVGPAGASPF